MKQFVIAITASITLALGFALPAYAVTYGGDATGAEVTVSATGTTIRAATGTLSISGGMSDAALLVGDIPGSATAGAVSLTASALHSAVVGVGTATNAEASMGAVSLTVSGNQISSDFLMARSKASCGPNPAVTGSSQLTNLRINGQTITVTGAPNQTVALPNGTAIINAQTSTVGGTAGELAVTALRVMTHDTLTGQPIADVLLTTVDAKIDCSSGSTIENWVTGGGWIDPTQTGKSTFGFVAGRREDMTLRGHLTYKDHLSGVTVHGTVINEFTECNLSLSPAQTVFLGTGTSSQLGGNVTFEVRVQDAGEPGSADTFTIIVNDGAYTNSGTLLGGNVKAHGFTCP